MTNQTSRKLPASAFRPGDRVTTNRPGNRYHGLIGEVVRLCVVHPDRDVVVYFPVSQAAYTPGLPFVLTLPASILEKVDD